MGHGWQSSILNSYSVLLLCPKKDPDHLIASKRANYAREEQRQGHFSEEQHAPQMLNHLVVHLPIRSSKTGVNVSSEAKKFKMKSLSVFYCIN